MRILIIGKNYCSRALADYFAQDTSNLVFTTIGNSEANFVDISHYDVEELKEFALANEIDLSVICEAKAMTYDFVKVFNENNLTIFSPDSEALKVVLSRGVGKRFLYKNKIQTPKFGIFDKLQLALEYIRAQNVPLIIKPDNYYEDYNSKKCETFPKAKLAVEKLFENGIRQVVIENYIEGKEFTYYFISDGYNAVPIDYCATYKDKYSCLGADLIGDEMQNKILNTIVKPTVLSLAKSSRSYIGILGVDFVLDYKGNLYTIEYTPFIKDLHIDMFLASILEDKAKLLNSAIVGSLLDEFEDIKKANMNFITAKKENGDVVFEYGRTVSEAKEKIMDTLENKEIASWLD